MYRFCDMNISSGRRVTEDESDWKKYDPNADEIVNEVYNKSGKTRPKQFPEAVTTETQESSSIANLEIGPRPIVSLFITQNSER